ncbi:hypothetical protein BJ170DRAFT_597719 [Xylariales sp. AK1849]|nr:hypothetical protein BJ170DRAFT_597719 [Xylariales sp. AK1849]
MTETRGSVRQRKAKATAAQPEEKSAVVEELTSSEPEDSEAPIEKPTTKARVRSEDDYSPWLDVLRVLTFLLVASAGLSYLISSGESFTWGMKHPPKYLRTNWWKEQLKGPVNLTPAELAQYDGSDDTKPIYLAINGTIYDVSANKRTYGPGGSYHVFAGVDAARGFVTGCFGEDRTADMRGVEDMYIPVDDPEVDKHYTAAELEALKKTELADASKRVHEGLSHWVNFFKNSPKYPRVGHVKRQKNWLDKEPRRKLCDQAAKGRPKRKVPGAYI